MNAVPAVNDSTVMALNAIPGSVTTWIPLTFIVSRFAAMTDPWTTAITMVR